MNDYRIVPKEEVSVLREKLKKKLEEDGLFSWKTLEDELRKEGLIQQINRVYGKGTEIYYIQKIE